jgi:glutamate/tyrosine decarboxylase-like PLP-dependent enzyme
MLHAEALNELETAFGKLCASIAAGPITPQVTPAEIRQHLDTRYAFDAPLPLSEVVADVESMLDKWQVHVTHPRYFGLFNPSVTLASVVGDTLAAMYNPQLATWRTSPAPNEIERHTLAWLAGKFGFPPSSHATFTSGGAEANFSAVVAALTHTFPAYGVYGLRAIPKAPCLYLSTEAHHSFHKIAHMTGLGRDALRTVSAGSDLKLDLRDLAAQVAKDRDKGLAPFMVVATAGTTGAGVIDPLAETASFCREQGLWLHVDAAWGGAAVLSPRLRPFLVGIEAADSITCDAHKWFSVPMGAGMFFCRHPRAIAEAFRAETSYMPPITEGGVQDPYTSSVQWSRRFIGLKLFLSLAEKGEAGYAATIEQQSAMGGLLRVSLEETGWRIVNETPLPVVCFTRPGLDVSAFVADLQSNQIAWISEVRLNGGSPVLRACVTSFLTSADDVRQVVAELTQRCGEARESRDKRSV